MLTFRCRLKNYFLPKKNKNLKKFGSSFETTSTKSVHPSCKFPYCLLRPTPPHFLSGSIYFHLYLKSGDILPDTSTQHCYILHWVLTWLLLSTLDLDLIPDILLLHKGKKSSRGESGSFTFGVVLFRVPFLYRVVTIQGIVKDLKDW